MIGHGGVDFFKLVQKVILISKINLVHEPISQECVVTLHKLPLYMVLKIIFTWPTQF